MAPQLGITVIEDNETLRDTTLQALKFAGYQAHGMPTTDEFDELGAAPVDIVIIDLNLPGEDGLTFARRLRAAQQGIGIIMLTARSSIGDRITGYQSGADIYLTKPTSMEELLSAVQALGTRIAASQMQSGQATLGQRTLQLEFANQSATLTELEARILTALARAAGQRLEKWQLLEIAGSDDFSKGALEVRLARLRKKLAKIGLPAQAIRPIRNFGYQLCIGLRLI